MLNFMLLLSGSFIFLLGPASSSRPAGLGDAVAFWPRGFVVGIFSASTWHWKGALFGC